MLPEALRARVAPLFSDRMSPYDPCHDLHHVDRVARNARHLARLEGADEEVCAAAAYLHDLDRAGAADPLAAARAHLAAVGADERTTARVLEAVERHKDKSFAPGGVRPMSLEAAVLADADKLEAIGAIGIARAFSFGGLKGRPLWEGPPADAPREVVAPAPRAPGEAHPLVAHLAARETGRLYVSGAKGATIDHFFQKLLRLEGDFHTKSGRALARRRHEFLVEFLGEFFDEWDATA